MTHGTEVHAGKARNATSRNTRTPSKLLEAVDGSLKTHPVYLFSRVQRAHRQFELWDDALAWLDKATGARPDAERVVVRAARHAARTAGVARASDRLQGRSGLLRGPWRTAGRSAVPVRLDGADGPAGRQGGPAGHFEAMRARDHNARVDLAGQLLDWPRQAGGRRQARRERGVRQAARATARSTTACSRGPSLVKRGVLLKDLPEPEGRRGELRAELELVQAVRLLAGNGKGRWRCRCCAASRRPQDGGELRLRGTSWRTKSTRIKPCHHHRRGRPTSAASRSTCSTSPRTGCPGHHVAEIDHAAIYAITRQESHFQVDAVSSAGARGLMQLMPGTAKETAQKVGVEYSKSRLVTDGAYNALLGSTYLAAQLDRYNGSLVLAAAAYNAGPGNANKWIKANGDPRDAAIDPVVWIEQIPVSETRNYVKRVLGNYLVYRSQLGRDDISGCSRCCAASGLSSRARGFAKPLRFAMAVGLSCC
jgi:soluble lytic murein transglycosylase